MDYYFADGDQQQGPYAREALLGQGVKPDSLVWREGMASWERAESLAELRDLFVGLPQLYPTVPDYTPAPTYTPAPAPYGSPGYGAPADSAPAYGAPAAGTPAAYGGAGQPLAYGGYSPASAPPASGLAIASMILGILSMPMTCVYLIGTPGAILAVIFGHLARGKARRGEAGGEGMALAGLICGYISLALAAAGIAFFVIVMVFAAAHG